MVDCVNCVVVRGLVKGEGNNEKKETKKATTRS